MHLVAPRVLAFRAVTCIDGCAPWQGYRILMLCLAMLPMMLAGAIIGLARHDLYPVYDICGRFAPVSPLTDQQLGGLIIWIPGTVLLVSIAMLVLRRTLHQDHAAHTASVPPIA
jgi:cytochrome c oxidase assembly factor CtaG